MSKYSIVELIEWLRKDMVFDTADEFDAKIRDAADAMEKMQAALVVARKLIYIVVAREVILQDGYDVDKHPVIMQIDAALGK